MSARYHVLVSDELMKFTQATEWASCGLRPVEQEPTDPERHPGMHWWLFDDEGAPPELNGKLVDLTFEAVYGVAGKSARITDRRVAAWAR